MILATRRTAMAPQRRGFTLHHLCASTEKTHVKDPNRWAALEHANMPSLAVRYVLLVARNPILGHGLLRLPQWKLASTHHAV